MRIGFRRMFPAVTKWNKNMDDSPLFCFDSFKYLKSTPEGQVLMEEKRSYYLYDIYSDIIVKLNDTDTYNMYQKIFNSDVVILETIEKFTAEERKDIVGNIYFN